MQSDADRLLAVIPIESYIQRYLTLKLKGRNYWAICPFHSEKSPSFSVSPEKGIFKCFGCGKGGNLITFVQEYDKVDFKEALRLLSEYSGIPLQGRSAGGEKKHDWNKSLASVQTAVKDVYKAQLNDPEVSQYIASRNIQPETAAHFQLGYAPPSFRFLESAFLSKLQGEKKQFAEKALYELGLIAKSRENEPYNRFKGRLIFPIFGRNGECIAFGGRIIRKIDAGKYVNSPESPLFHKKQTLYNFYNASEEIRKAGQVILVEGYLDVLGLFQIGIKNAVAPLGTAFTEEQAKMLKRYTDNVIIFFDGDSAGIEAAYRSLVIARDQKLNPRVVVLSGAYRSMDPFDISQKLDVTETLALLDGARNEISFILWYFFSHKYNIQNLDEKREAMTEFFDCVLKLSQDWEREEYLNEASVKLSIDKEMLRSDMAKTAQGIPVSPREKKEIFIQTDYPVGSIEKEILGILLRFPYCWNDKVLLDEIEWSGKNSYLLYVFFRDRLRGGEFWKWEELNKVMNVLPDDGMVKLLSEILFSMENVFEEENNSEANENLDEEYEKKLRKLIMIQKKDRLIKKIEAKNIELNDAEKNHPETVDEITEEIATLLGEKRKVEDFLSAKR